VNPPIPALVAAPESARARIVPAFRLTFSGPPSAVHDCFFQLHPQAVGSVWHASLFRQNFAFKKTNILQ
jgi:hypothetical protein